MKARLLLALALGLLLTACGSPGDTGDQLSLSEPTVQDEDARVATQVAATVAVLANVPEGSTGQQSGSTELVEPLTPIPQLDSAGSPDIEVSPEVELVESAPTATDARPSVEETSTSEAPTAAPTPSVPPTPDPTISLPVGSTFFPYQEDIAVSLERVEFIDEFPIPGTEGVWTPSEGFRLLQLSFRATSLVSRSAAKNHTLFDGVPYIYDRDNDRFYCRPTYALPLPRRFYFLPGTGVDYDVLCEIPVTAAADGLDGLLAPTDGRALYDLGDDSGTPTDFSQWLQVIPSVSLPISINDLCAEASDVVSTIRQFHWLDAPPAVPPEDLVELAKEQNPENGEGRALEIWQQVWEPYNRDSLDVVALSLETVNGSKEVIGDPFESLDSGTFVVDPETLFASLFLPGDEQEVALYPHALIIGRNIPPGGTRSSTAYVLVDESAESLQLLFTPRCSSASDVTVLINIPRE